MNILYLNKFFHIVGGVDRNFFAIAELMEKKGHRTSFFFMDHPLNKKTGWEKFAVSNISFEKTGIINRARQMGRILYSTEAASKLTLLIDKYKPEIAHLHSVYHHLSPSVLQVLRKKGIPVIQSLGDYHLISPNYNMFHGGQICEITKKDRFYRALFHRCVKNSFSYSLAEVLEKYFQKILGWERNYIEYFIVPSLFMKNKLTDYGISAKKIIFLPHFIEEGHFPSEAYDGEYLLYFGRLSAEKGLLFLLEVMKHLPQIKLIIAGRGPLEEEMRQKIHKLNLKNVEMAGFLEGENLRWLISGAKFTVLPSLWYEVFGLSILESQAFSKPALAAKTGGIPEIIKNGYNGLLFAPGDMADCIRKIKSLWNNQKLRKRLAKNALKDIRMKYSAEIYYRNILEIYTKVKLRV